jgi:hypothetical protein
MWMMDVAQWAETEFGGATLGDVRRTRRLVSMAAEVASCPAGKVTEACASSASREGAFRWLENEAVRVEPVVKAAVRATVARCARSKRVYVPVDATSLSLTDFTGKKGLGAVGSWSQGSRGSHAMTAFAVAEDDSPMGVCGQRMWVRTQRSKTTARARSADLAHRETRFWLDLLTDTQSAFAETAPEGTPWFQLDRGADCWPVLAFARKQSLLLTVRAAHDRRVDHRAQSLWTALERSPLLGHVHLELPARPPRRKRQRKAGRLVFSQTPARRARTANLAVRAATVPLVLSTDTGKRTVEFNAVLVREVGRHPDDRIEWLLLTTHPVGTRADALAIVRGYKARWRIEELHRTWKRGLCRVEDTQLRSRNAIFKWATLLAVVAARAMRLTYLAREQPEQPADEELSPTEIEALIVLRKPKGIALGFSPSLAQAVRWLADLGGYTGPWNGPPGPTVVGRGLLKVLTAARAFENRKKMR